MAAKEEFSKGGRPSKTDTPRSSVSTTLNGLGITPKQSSQWQALTAVPEQQFKAALADQTKLKRRRRPRAARRGEHFALGSCLWICRAEDVPAVKFWGWGMSIFSAALAVPTAPAEASAPSRSSRA
jgi:hypothetical protein